MTDYDVILRGGAVVDGTGAEPRRADVALVGARVAAIGDFATDTARQTIEATGRLVFPGFIDAHSHADATIGTPRVQEAYLRQGVTSVILGQDGVSFAPSTEASLAYAQRYFAAINGSTVLEAPVSVARLLDGFEGSGGINVGYLVPAGVVRSSVIGSGSRAATDDELAEMTDIVATAMSEGALGLSTGLDYVPGIFADALELAALCAPVGRARGAYVSHLRGYSAQRIAAALGELAQIGASSGARPHVSHLHGSAAAIAGTLTALERENGVAISFDNYPYLRGNTIVAMLVLPTELQAGGIDATLRRLALPEVRESLRTIWFPKDTRLPSITLSYLSNPDYRWAEGLTLREAADRSTDGDVANFVCDALIACDLAVGCVVDNGADRTEDDMRQLLRDSRQLTSSDAIFLGSAPHPRGWGTFARLLGRHVRDLGDWTWGEAARHLSGHAAERFGLVGRGTLAPGTIADIAVVDPVVVRDNASYQDPTLTASGVDTVVVAGQIAVDHGELTGVTAGRALRAWDNR